MLHVTLAQLAFVARGLTFAVVLVVAYLAVRRQR
jgi:hypothetical protein